MEEIRKAEEKERYETPEMVVVELTESETIVASSCAYVYACPGAYSF